MLLYICILCTKYVRKYSTLYFNIDHTVVQCSIIHACIPDLHFEFLVTNIQCLQFKINTYTEWNRNLHVYIICPLGAHTHYVLLPTTQTCIYTELNPTCIIVQYVHVFVNTYYFLVLHLKTMYMIQCQMFSVQCAIVIDVRVLGTIQSSPSPIWSMT